MLIYGRELDRNGILRRANPETLVSLRRMKLEGQSGDGIRAFEAKNAAGLRAVFLQDKCLDPLELSYKGINISYLSKNGLTGNEISKGGGFGGYWSGGMMATCGLRNAGTSCTCDGEAFPHHGKIGYQPARILESRVTDDFSEIVLQGAVRETSLCAYNLELVRTIRIPADRARVEITDKIVNRGPERQIYIMLYHFNFGYPFLDEGIRLHFPQGKVSPCTETARKGLAEHDRITAPVDGFEEHCFIHDAEKRGLCKVELENPHLGIGASVSYDTTQIPHLVEWKMMRSGDYVLGIEPSTSTLLGREKELEAGYDMGVDGFGSVTQTVSLELFDL